MDQRSIMSRGKEFLHKYRYALLVVLVGLALMWIPGKQTETSPEPTETTAAPYDLAAEMECILAKVQDAGQVKVLLTQASGEETVYQTNEDRDGDSLRVDTVIVTDSDRNQEGLIRQVISPKYQGAVVLCQGADSASVRLAIVEAVSKLTGLSTDRICVLKMK